MEAQSSQIKPTRRRKNIYQLGTVPIDNDGGDYCHCNGDDGGGGDCAVVIAIATTTRSTSCMHPHV